MNKSIFLARVMGLFLLILSLSLLIHGKSLIPAVTMILQNGALQFIIGMILVMLGSLLVVSHNVWTKSWVIIITILSWLILIKGIIYLMFPTYLQAISQQFSDTGNGIYIGGVINLVIGLYLCFMGFFASKR